MELGRATENLYRDLSSAQPSRSDCCVHQWEPCSETNCLYIIDAWFAKKLKANVFQMLKMQTILSITILMLYTFP